MLHTTSYWRLSASLVCILGLFASFPASAAQHVNKFLADFNRRYELSLSTASFLYKQGGLATNADQQTGFMPGAKFSVSTIDGGTYFAFDVRYYAGSNRFTGYYRNGSNSVPYGFSTKNNDVILAHGRIGVPFNFYSQLITPYIQLGFYMWNRTLLAPPTTYGAEASETYEHFDLSLGLKYDLPLTDKWVVESFASIGKTLHPTVNVGVKESSTVIPDFALGGSRPLIEAGINSYYKLSRDLDFALGATLESFQYGNSTSLVSNSGANYALSGKSSTIMIWTANLGFSWRFRL